MREKMMSTWRVRWLLLSLAILCLFEQAWPLDPTWGTSQYIRDQWDANSGFVGGQVNAIAQTKDGYLWIGTDKGLYRFDGLRFVAVQQPDQALPTIQNVLGLATDDHGDLWVRMEGPNVLRYQDGIFRDALPHDGVKEDGVTAMSQGNDGTILVSTITHGAFRYNKGKLESLASNTALPHSLIISVAQTTDGRVWLGTRDHGLFYMEKGTAIAVTNGLPDKKINSLLSVGNGALLIGTDNGIAQLDKGRISQSYGQSLLRNTQVLAMTKDRDSNVWVGTESSLVRLNANGASQVDLEGTHSREEIAALFEDREGNVWVGCRLGLVRLRNGAFVTYSIGQGLPSTGNGPVYVDAAQRIWFAPTDGGLYWMKNGKVESVQIDELNHDVVYSIWGSERNLWMGRRANGLTRLSVDGDVVRAKTYKQGDGLAQNSVYTVYESRDGTVWAGTLSGGLSRLRNGKFLTYTKKDGLGANTIYSIEEGDDGSIWVGTSGGLSNISNGHLHNFTFQDGLPSNDVISLHEDSRGILWIGTTAGLAYMASSQIHTLSEAIDSLKEPVLGITDDGSDSLWMATSNHILRVNRSALLDRRLGETEIREYGIDDGLLNVGGVKRDQSVVNDRNGHIWFSTDRGLSAVDWRKQRNDSPPTIAHIDAISSDGNPAVLGAVTRIPPSPRRVAIDYTGLNLSTPDRVRFQYRLEGFDRNWSEPIAARQAIYTNLPPGTYRFTVKASNSDGLWNGSEATLAFKIEPAFWQTLWFQLLCALVVLYTALLLYRFRLSQVTKQLNTRFDERLAERTRIAHELHDTLLQGLMSASMQLHVATENVPENSIAKSQLNHILELMGRVSEEGRNTLRGLRSSVSEPVSLEEALSSIPNELSIPEETRYRMVVDGPVRPLHPVIRDEVYCIGREALLNAVRHAKANSIEVELEYTLTNLLLVVRDNGCGIDPDVLKSGRNGHWGLPGMRERAEGIGAELRLFSRSGAGTEVELTIPSKIAYKVQSGSTLSRWLIDIFPTRFRIHGRKNVNRESEATHD